MVDKLEIEALFAKDEDAWEGMVSGSVGEEEGKSSGGVVHGEVEGREALESGWSEEVVKARKGLEKDLKVQKRQWLEIGRKMGKIVEMEEQMAIEERMHRNEEKEGKRKAKQNGVDKTARKDNAKVVPSSNHVRIIDESRKT